MSVTYFFMLLFVFLFWLKVSVFMTPEVKVGSVMEAIGHVLLHVAFALLGTFFFHNIW